MGNGERGQPSNADVQCMRVCPPCVKDAKLNRGMQVKTLQPTKMRMASRLPQGEARPGLSTLREARTNHSTPQ